MNAGIPPPNTLSGLDCIICYDAIVTWCDVCMARATIEVDWAVKMREEWAKADAALAERSGINLAKIAILSLLGLPIQVQASIVWFVTVALQSR